MTWVKGQSGNKTGLSSNALKRLHALESLSFPAIARLKELIGSDNEGVALAACREVLSRVVPVPKAPLLAVQVNQSSPHLEALKALALNTVPANVPRLEGQVIDNADIPSYDALNLIEKKND